MGPRICSPPIGCTPREGRTPRRFSYWLIGLVPLFRRGAQRAPAKYRAAVIRRGGYYPPTVYQLPCMLLFSGASYLAEALEHVIEQNGSDNIPTPFMRLPRRPQVPGYQKSAPGSGPAGPALAPNCEPSAAGHGWKEGARERARNGRQAVSSKADFVPTRLLSFPGK